LKSNLHKPQSILSFIFILCLVLAVSLVFGHVLGSYYLENIIKNDNQQKQNIEYQPSTASGENVKKKVLRLKKTSYSTIQAGVFSDWAVAIELGNALAQKGFPAVITEEKSYLVMIGFLNNNDNLAILANSITIDGQKPKVIQREINSISFKFDVGDDYAEKYVAPFLGNLSNSLQKGIMLYSDINIEDRNLTELRAGFKLLANEVAQIASAGEAIADKGKATTYHEGLLILVKRCSSWAESLNKLENDCQQLTILLSQQQALALLEDYHRFMAITN
jgi:hypothetical protein